MRKTIVNFTPTGMIPTKKDCSFVPVAASEIIEDVRTACELGITMVHLHARDTETGMPTFKKEIYADIISGVRSFAPELIICVSTSGRTENSYKSRSEVLALCGDVKPDMASLTLSSLNFNKSASINEPGTVIALAREMNSRGIKPELEVFDLGMANYANYLVRKGILNLPLYVNLILGNVACAQSDLIHIGCLARDLPAGTIISMGGVGNYQFMTNSLAVSIGYGVRIGLEDNIWLDDERTRLASNMDLLKRIKRIIEANESEVMTPAELRQLLGLKEGYGEYGMVE